MGLACMITGHNYVLEKIILPVKEGYATQYKYRCTKCKDTYTEYIYE